MTGSLPPRRVVIAEDEALIRLDLKEMLEGEGYVVVAEAGDGETAVRLAEEHRPGPGDPRREDARAGRDHGGRTHRDGRIAPVLMLTAFSQRELVARAREAGAMAYLVKPFRRADLVPAIEVAVARHEEILALEAEVESLEDRLTTRTLVDRAKAVLERDYGLSEPQAFRWIQKTSMDRRSTMREVAQTVISAGSDPGGAGAGTA